MDLGLKGKVAIVAAASKGLGKACAIALAKEGVNVVICSRNQAELLEAAREIGSTTGVEVLAIPTDVTKPDDVVKLVEQAVARFGRIDILVNNAGGPPAGTFETLGDEDWAKALELNLLSTVRLTRAVLPHLKKQGSGRIINITSYAVKQPIAELILSNAARAGVTGLAKSLSNEFGKYNITVNNVLPGLHTTARIDYLHQSRAKSQNRTFEEIRVEETKQIPLGRLGDPADFGSIVAFLASEPAGYITGQSLVIDGGAYKGLM
ncbi:MAG: SDR family oxidoreductase [Chloroflexota bacterium]|nr:SDR family oxidoreductase [Chloroflexota bacterium]